MNISNLLPCAPSSKPWMMVLRRSGRFIRLALLGSQIALDTGRAAKIDGAELTSKAELVMPAEVRFEPDVAYLPPERREKADLYVPRERPAGKMLPAVIIIHGGGFNDGDKARKREVNIGTNLALHGYVGMSINYKLCKTQGQVTWPQCLHDAQTAVRWLRGQAGRLGIDPERIGAFGGSAGGNLAVMLAVTGPGDGLDAAGTDTEISARVQCAVDFYGAVDLPNYHDMKMFARTRAEAPELYDKASPVTYVDKADSPILIVHGSADETVALSQSETLAAALKKAGVEHEFVVIPGAPHTFHLQPKQRDLRPLVFGFFDKHLKSQEPSSQSTSLPNTQQHLKP